ncbi:MAG: sodium:solute symporter [Verrucomicrobiales bacterium]
MLETNFSALDWAIVGAYLVGTVIIGLWVNRYIKGMGEFLVAGRSLKTRLGIATMIGSELGLVTAMFAAQKGFSDGFAAFHIGLMAGIATIIVGFTGFIVVPLRRMGVMTIPEYYEKRFGSRNLRILGGFILAVAGILNMGLFLKAGAIFVSGITGIDGDAVKWVMTAMILLVLIYTCLGGMISVIITDYVQFVVLSIGLLVTCVIAVQKIGWSTLVKGVETIYSDQGFNPFIAEGIGGSYVAWMFFLGVISCAVWQTAVMRACAAESVEVVKKMYIWSSLGFMIRFLIPQFIGICALVYFFDMGSAQPFFDGQGQVSDDPNVTMKAMPVFLGQLLPVGLLGIVAAGMIAAFMSTHDTYLLCWASVLTEDVFNPLNSYNMSDKQRILLTRTLLILIAAFLVMWGLWYPLGQDLWDYMAVSGSIYFTGAFAILMMGLYWKKASVVGAYSALIIGTFAIFGLGPVQKFFSLEEFFNKNEIAGHHIGLTVSCLAIIGMIIMSVSFPNKESNPEKI